MKCLHSLIRQAGFIVQIREVDICEISGSVETGNDPTEFDADSIVTPDGKYILLYEGRIFWISAVILEKYN